MQQWQAGVRLKGMPPIRRRYQNSVACNPKRLRQKPSLLGSAADVLDYGVRVDEIKRSVGKRQRPGIPLNQGQVWILGAQLRQVFDAQPADAFRVRIPFLQVIGRVMVFGRYAYIQDGLCG
jgi:hypothetical protein